MPIDVSTLSEIDDYSQSTATKMLAAGLDRLRAERGMSQKDVALSLGYKSSVAMSHMAVGRVPIPIERAPELADALGLDRATFLMAVLEQRFPSMDMRQLLGIGDQRAENVASRLTLIAGHSLDYLSQEAIGVLEEVVASVRPASRWLSPSEFALFELIRKQFPELSRRALTVEELTSLTQALREALNKNGASSLSMPR